MINNEVIEEIVEFDFNSFWDTLQQKAAPCFEQLKFETYEHKRAFSDEDILAFQLDSIIENYEEKLVMPAYSIELSADFRSLVIYTEENEHEIKATLINYTNDNEFIDKLNVSYDEIAESAYSFESEIASGSVLTTSFTTWDETIIEKEKYLITEAGYFVKPGQ